MGLPLRTEHLGSYPPPPSTSSDHGQVGGRHAACHALRHAPRPPGIPLGRHRCSSAPAAAPAPY
eukprot:3035771-Pyramimonas_sp.AAC.1